jgi:hypothetical protein
MSQPNGTYDSTPAQYRSKLADWEERASVRQKPRHLIEERDLQEHLAFPPELLAITVHPAVQRFGPDILHALLLRRLYLYLDFTDKLELEVVNPVAKRIACGQLGLDLPPQMLLDARKICCDEDYHAFQATDLKYQLEAMTGVVAPLRNRPQFLDKLQVLEAPLEPPMRDMAHLFFVIVSETLISALLSQIPRDPRIIGAVRETVADHAADEGRHHAYFSRLLQVLWPKLSTAEQRLIGSLLPEFILAFLTPDSDALEDLLVCCGLSTVGARLVLKETYPRSVVVAGANEGAKATIRLLTRNGVLTDGRTAAIFQASALTIAS